MCVTNSFSAPSVQRARSRSINARRSVNPVISASSSPPLVIHVDAIVGVDEALVPELATLKRVRNPRRAETQEHLTDGVGDPVRAELAAEDGPPFTQAAVAKRSLDKAGHAVIVGGVGGRPRCPVVGVSRGLVHERLHAPRELGEPFLTGPAEWPCPDQRLVEHILVAPGRRCAVAAPGPVFLGQRRPLVHHRSPVARNLRQNRGQSGGVLPTFRVVGRGGHHREWPAAQALGVLSVKALGRNSESGRIGPYLVQRDQTLVTIERRVLYGLAITGPVSC